VCSAYWSASESSFDSAWFPRLKQKYVKLLRSLAFSVHLCLCQTAYALCFQCLWHYTKDVAGLPEWEPSADDAPEPAGKGGAKRKADEPAPAKVRRCKFKSVETCLKSCTESA
jgi:hypothetical protein